MGHGWVRMRTDIRFSYSPRLSVSGGKGRTRADPPSPLEAFARRYALRSKMHVWAAVDGRGYVIPTSSCSKMYGRRTFTMGITLSRAFTEENSKSRNRAESLVFGLGNDRVFMTLVVRGRRT